MITIGRISVEQLRSEHLQYMLSDHWEFLRKQVFIRDKFKCASCQSPDALRGHHIVYRRPMTLCDADDILTLCRNCHDTLHRELNATGSSLLAIRTRSATLSFLNRLRMFKESRPPMYPKAKRVKRRKPQRPSIKGMARKFIRDAINKFQSSGYNPEMARPLIEVLEKYSRLPVNGVRVENVTAEQ